MTLASVVDYIPQVWPLVVVILLSAIVSRALGVSFVLTAVFGFVPLALPAIEQWRLGGQLSTDTPEELMLAGWTIGFLSLGLLKVMKPFISAIVGKFGVVRLAHGILLISAVVVSALLVFEPTNIKLYIPFWSTGLGFSLLSATVVSMVFALIRTLRASLLFVVWSCVSIILASELFFHKPLFHLTKRDISEVLPVEVGSFDALVRQPRLWLDTLVGEYVLSSQTTEKQAILPSYQLDVRDAAVSLPSESTKTLIVSPS